MIDSAQILDWLTADGYACSLGEPVGEGMRWHIVAEANNSRSQVICIEPGDILQLQHALRLTDEHRSAVYELAAEERRKFFFDLIRDLALGDFQYGLEKNPESVKVTLVARLFEPVTRGDLFNAITKLRNTSQLPGLRVRLLTGGEL